MPGITAWIVMLMFGALRGLRHFPWELCGHSRERLF